MIKVLRTLFIIKQIETPTVIRSFCEMNRNRTVVSYFDSPFTLMKTLFVVSLAFNSKKEKGSFWALKVKLEKI